MLSKLPVFQAVNTWCPNFRTLTNVAYAVFVCIICIKKFQFAEFLFSKEIDEVILNAFVVFLSFEGIRSSYKRIHLSAISLFQKILRLLDT